MTYILSSSSNTISNQPGRYQVFVSYDTLQADTEVIGRYASRYW